MDRRIGAAEGSIVVAEGSSATITHTDYGAVRSALDAVLGTTQSALTAQTATSRAALDAGTAALDRAFDYGESVTSDALGFGNEALGLIEQSNQNAYKFALDASKDAEERTFQDLTKWAALAALGYFAMKAVRG
jgi:hypothetical protein